MDCTTVLPVESYILDTKSGIEVVAAGPIRLAALYLPTNTWFISALRTYSNNFACFYYRHKHNTP